MKKLLQLTLSLLILVGLVSCDALGLTEEEAEFDKTYTYQVKWDVQLTGDYNHGVTIADTSNATVYTDSGAMQLGQVTSAISTDGFFGDDNAVQYIHNGTNDWGGIFFNGGTALDISSATAFKVAIKGTISADLTCMGLKVEGGNGSAQELNLLSYTPATDGDWTIYTVPTADYDLVEFSGFHGIGLWNPKSGTDLTFEGGYQATDFIVDIAIK
ncbi:MAG: hypothetical protein JXR64_06880 [Spirochaetales bacterium]|nr:hypothetical protein [Spirochaetales bacterium]